MEQKPVYSDEDEIDLIELWQTLRKHKAVIIITTFVFVSAAIIYLLMAKPVYEAVATLKIGGQLINGNKKIYFEDANKLKERLDVKYNVSGKFRKKGILSYVENVSIPRKTRGFITITVDGPNNLEAKATLSKVIKQIIDKHSIIYKSIIGTKETTIKLYNELIILLSKEINKQNMVVLNLRRYLNKIQDKNPNLSALIILQIGQIKRNIVVEQDKINNLKKEIYNLQLTMHSPYLVMTQIVGKIYTHNYPVKPKKKLILVVAFITGLIFGIFLVFFLEFIRKARELET